jgi:hypothetical protein
MSTDSEIVLDGDWVEALRPNRRWIGVVRASQPFVVLLAGTSAGRIVWAKSRPGAKNLEMPVRFHMHDLDHLGTRVQFLLHVGDGYVQDLEVEIDRPDVLPTYVMPMNLQFGVLQEIFQARGKPPTNMKLLLLQRSWVKMGRTGIWRVREMYLDQIPRELAAIVMEGRSGDGMQSAP